MPKISHKRVWMSDFLAWIEWLQGRDGKPYYKVQPDYEGRVLSHSIRPQGGAHAREWADNKEDKSTSTFVPDSAVLGFQIDAGAPYRLNVPETAATASFAPVQYDAFLRFKATKREADRNLEVASPTTTVLSVVFWEGEPGNYRPISFAVGERTPKPSC